VRKKSLVSVTEYLTAQETQTINNLHINSKVGDTLSVYCLLILSSPRYWLSCNACM